jgi:signal transduction histidine kinase
MSRLLRGVTAQLLLLTVLPLTVILAVISFASIAMHQDAMRRLVSDRDVRAVAATADTVGAKLQHKADVLQLIAEHAARGSVTNTLMTYSDLVGEFPAGIALYDRNGVLLTSTDPATGWAPTGLTDPAFSLPPGTPGSHIVVRDDALVLRAQDRSGSVTAVGVLPVSTLQFDALVNPPGGAGTVSAFLFGADGYVLASTRPERANADEHDHPGVAEALRGQSGGLFRPDPATGEEHVVSYAPVVTSRGPTGLGVVIEEPWQVVLDPLMRYSLAMPLITLPVLLLAMLAVMFGVWRIVQPLQKLDQQARELGRGHYGALSQPVKGIQEVEQLQATLRTMAGQIQADQERLRSYAHAVTETQEAERKRLTRELHDDTIQGLIVLSQRIQALRQAAAREPPPPAATAGKLDELRRAVLQMIEDVRRFSRALRPIYLEDAGLVAALERLAAEADAASLLGDPGTPTPRVTFSTGDGVPRYKPDVELALYRIAQEALSNALRHAAPTRVAISLTPLPGSGQPPHGVQLCIEDDGRGFSEPAPGPDGRDRPRPAGAAGDALSGGLGLTGIRERALLIGARVDIQSEPGKGTRVVVLYQDLG